MIACCISVGLYSNQDNHVKGYVIATMMFNAVVLTSRSMHAHDDTVLVTPNPQHLTAQKQPETSPLSPGIMAAFKSPFWNAVLTQPSVSCIQHPARQRYIVLWQICGWLLLQVPFVHGDPLNTIGVAIRRVFQWHPHPPANHILYSFRTPNNVLPLQNKRLQSVYPHPGTKKSPWKISEPIYHTLREHMRPPRPYSK